MTQVILSNVGGRIGGPIGQAIGSAVGAQIDQAAVRSLAPPRQIGPRLEALRFQGGAEGAPIPAVFGRARVVGQVIWAARFREHRRDGRAGKGGPRTLDYGYSLSFAVGLCEGPIDGIGRVWADGQPLDVSGVTLRLHRGHEDQAPDPLIEAVEGSAPAYRGLAYVVLEDLPLDAFGDRAPQLAFEVFRRPRGEQARLEDRLEGVCLIPGSGEFVYATTPVLRREGLFGAEAENLNNRDGRADLIVSLDQLQAQLPNLKRVTLVVSWFGDDLRCGVCSVKPRVDQADKVTLGAEWRVAGVERGEAEVVSQIDGAAAYGGTPSDASVIAAIEELKRRGLEVTVAPFLMMDIASGNGRADPYGGTEQSAFPWRGRLTCHPAPGRLDTVDGTSEAGAQVAAFFGEALAADFSDTEGHVVYAGPEEWSWRRMVLHHAWLARIGGADGLLIGSELRGLTTVRDEAGYPAVVALRALAQDCRAILGPDALITYAADWSEWSGVQHADDPGGHVFHLDPLWADAAVSCVGIDWYPPLTDWRDGDDHLDRLVGWSGASDPEYLAERVQGGEGWDWFYADEAGRLAQDRIAIADETHGEPWVFRPKDILGWWSHAHHDRIGGERALASTDWAPGMKPVRLIEFGCGAVDRGGNAPNLFIDPKSSESAAPPFSSGGRDDLVQRRAIEATLVAFHSEAANPAATAYDGRMLEAMDAWCWDARPFPDFPARLDIWSDGANWRTGHWLNGRMTGEAADLIQVVAGWSGVAASELEVSGIEGAADGYVIDRPMTGAEALFPLAAAFGVDVAEQGRRVAFLGRRPVFALDEGAIALPGEASAISVSRGLDEPPGALRLRFMDGAADYAIGTVVVRGAGEGTGSVELVDVPLVLDEARAEATAVAVLDRSQAATERMTLALSPLAVLRLEAGDLVTVPGDARTMRIVGIDLGEEATALLEPVVGPRAPRDREETWRPGPVVRSAAPPWFLVLDLPGRGRTEDSAPMIAAAARPWRPLDIHAGRTTDDLSLRGQVMRCATAGVLCEPLPAGPCDRWDEAAGLMVRLEGAALQSRSADAVLAGSNAVAVVIEGEPSEVIHFRAATLVADGVWRLNGLLRGQGGTERRASAVTPAGAWVVVLDEAVAPALIEPQERDAPLIWRTAAVGGPALAPAGEETVAIHRGLALRPWSPAHLKADLQPDGSIAIGWIRRARIDGDSWDREPPLNEEAECIWSRSWRGARSSRCST